MITWIVRLHTPDAATYLIPARTMDEAHAEACRRYNPVAPVKCGATIRRADGA